MNTINPKHNTVTAIIAIVLSFGGTKTWLNEKVETIRAHRDVLSERVDFLEAEIKAKNTEVSEFRKAAAGIASEALPEIKDATDELRKDLDF